VSALLVDWDQETPMKLPQLSLRELFWLVTVVAMALGWWIEHRLSQQRASDAQMWEARTISLKAHFESYYGGNVGFDGNTAWVQYPPPSALPSRVLP
jgi:hypothetical protein